MTKAKRAVPEARRDDETDGRRRRGNTSRAHIVDALLKLVQEGNFSPGAARVAEVAGVSLRTVFRHFDEMDSLYQEMAESIQARVLPVFLRPYGSDSWEGRLRELVDRRIELYEAVMPFKVSGDLKRFQSAYLARDYEKYLKLEKASLESVLPAAIVEDVVLANALRMATGFQSWRILRKDHELPLQDARAVVLRSVDALLAGHTPEGGKNSR